MVPCYMNCSDGEWWACDPGWEWAVCTSYSAERREVYDTQVQTTATAGQVCAAGDAISLSVQVLLFTLNFYCLWCHKLLFGVKSHDM